MKDKKKDLKGIDFKFNDGEISLFKNTFCENTTLLKLVSNVFLQLELSETDKTILTNAFKGNRELLKLMRKKLVAELDPNSPLGLNSDIWKEIKTQDVSPEMVLLDIKAKGVVLALLEEGLKKLADIDYKYVVEMKDLVDFKGQSADNIYSNLKGRNDFLNHISSQMFSILTLSGMKDETVEDIKQRMAMNSSK